MTVSIRIPMKRFFPVFTSEAGLSQSLHLQRPPGPPHTPRTPSPVRCLWKESPRKRVILSDGIAKEIPAATFRVLIPITSPSCRGRSRAETPPHREVGIEQGGF